MAKMLRSNSNPIMRECSCRLCAPHSYRRDNKVRSRYRRREERAWRKDWGR